MALKNPFLDDNLSIYPPEADESDSRQEQQEPARIETKQEAPDRPAGQLYNPFLEDDLSIYPDSSTGYMEESFVEEEPLSDKPKHAEFLDYVKSVGMGGGEVVKGVGWVLERTGAEEAGETVIELGENASKFWYESLTPQAKQAMGRSYIEKDPNSFTGYKLGDFTLETVGLSGAQSLLGTAAGMGAGAFFTRGLALIPGVSRSLAATVGYSSGEAFVAAPMAGAQAEQEIDQMTDEELAMHPEHKALIEKGETFESARYILKRAAGGESAYVTLLTTALLSAPFGKILDDVIDPKVLKGSFLGRAAKGGITEFFQEMGQSAAEQASVNLAIYKYADQRRSLGEGVPNAAVGGALAGFGLGATLGGFQTPQIDATEGENDPGNNKSVTDTLNAANEEQALESAAEAIEELDQEPITVGPRKVEIPEILRTIEGLPERLEDFPDVKMNRHIEFVENVRESLGDAVADEVDAYFDKRNDFAVQDRLNKQKQGPGDPPETVQEAIDQAEATIDGPLPPDDLSTPQKYARGSGDTSLPQPVEITADSLDYEATDLSGLPGSINKVELQEVTGENEKGQLVGVARIYTDQGSDTYDVAFKDNAISPAQVDELVEVGEIDEAGDPGELRQYETSGGDIFYEQPDGELTDTIDPKFAQERFDSTQEIDDDFGGTGQFIEVSEIQGQSAGPETTESAVGIESEEPVKAETTTVESGDYLVETSGPNLAITNKDAKPLSVYKEYYLNRVFQDTDGIELSLSNAELNRDAYITINRKGAIRLEGVGKDGTNKSKDLNPEDLRQFFDEEFADKIGNLSVKVANDPDYGIEQLQEDLKALFNITATALVKGVQDNEREEDDVDEVTSEGDNANWEYSPVDINEQGELSPEQEDMIYALDEAMDNREVDGYTYDVTEDAIAQIMSDMDVTREEVEAVLDSVLDLTEITYPSEKTESTADQDEDISSDPPSVSKDSEPEKPFPVLNAPGAQANPSHPKFVNQSALDEKRAKQNHSQTLKQLAIRGGLSAEEMYSIVNDVNIDEAFAVSSAEMDSFMAKIAYAEPTDTAESTEPVKTADTKDSADYGDKNEIVDKDEAQAARDRIKARREGESVDSEESSKAQETAGNVTGKQYKGNVEGLDNVYGNEDASVQWYWNGEQKSWHVGHYDPDGNHIGEGLWVDKANLEETVQKALDESTEIQAEWASDSQIVEETDTNTESELESGSADAEAVDLSKPDDIEHGPYALDTARIEAYKEGGAEYDKVYIDALDRARAADPRGTEWTTTIIENAITELVKTRFEEEGIEEPSLLEIARQSTAYRSIVNQLFAKFDEAADGEAARESQTEGAPELDSLNLDSERVFDPTVTYDYVSTGPSQIERYLPEDIERLEIDTEAFKAANDQFKTTFETPGEYVITGQEAKNVTVKSLEEAADQIKEWKAQAEKQQILQNQNEYNANKIILSLFDYSGSWSQPYADAGYWVVRVDIQDGQDIMQIDNQWVDDNLSHGEIYGVLAACPCTVFANSGNKWKKTFVDQKTKKTYVGRNITGATESGKDLVFKTMSLIEYLNPKFWVLENPVGQIEKMTGLPSPRMSFEPWHFGDPYTKKTILYGNFNADLPLNPVEPETGSKMKDKFGGKSLETKNARSKTPDGFAYAFFQANNAFNDTDEETLINEYPEISGAVTAALNAGIIESDIRSMIEDLYLYEKYNEAASLLALAADVKTKYPDTNFEEDGFPEESREQEEKILSAIRNNDPAELEKAGGNQAYAWVMSQIQLAADGGPGGIHGIAAGEINKGVHRDGVTWEEVQSAVESLEVDENGDVDAFELMTAIIQLGVDARNDGREVKGESKSEGSDEAGETIVLDQESEYTRIQEEGRRRVGRERKKYKTERKDSTQIQTGIRQYGLSYRDDYFEVTAGSILSQTGIRSGYLRAERLFTPIESEGKRKNNEYEKAARHNATRTLADILGLKATKISSKAIKDSEYNGIDNRTGNFDLRNQDLVIKVDANKLDQIVGEAQIAVIAAKRPMPDRLVYLGMREPDVTGEEIGKAKYAKPDTSYEYAESLSSLAVRLEVAGDPRTANTIFHYAKAKNVPHTVKGRELVVSVANTRLKELEKQEAFEERMEAQKRANETGKLVVGPDDTLLFPEDPQEVAREAKNKQENEKTEKEIEAEQKIKDEEYEAQWGERDRQVDAAREKITSAQAEEIAERWFDSYRNDKAYADSEEMMKSSYISGFMGTEYIHPENAVLTEQHPDVTEPAKMGWRDIQRIGRGSPDAINIPELGTPTESTTETQREEPTTTEEPAAVEEPQSVESQTQTTKKRSSDYGKTNKIVNEDQAQAARDRIKARSTRLKANVDPEDLVDAAIVATFHIEAGARKFVDFAKAMVQDLGDWITPYLRSQYESRRYDPDVISAGYDQDMTDGAEVGELVEQIEAGTLDLSTEEAEEDNVPAVVSEDTEADPATEAEETKETALEGQLDPETITEEELPSPSDVDMYDFLSARINLITDNRILKNYVAEYEDKTAADVTDQEMKAAQEMVELALVEQARRTMRSSQNEKDAYDQLVSEYNNQPNLSVRTATSMENQAYSTPAPLAMIASQLAGIDSETIVYEPTAGNGMLLIGADINNSFVNEINTERNQNLGMLGYFPTQEDATEFTPNETVDAVIMNPPFGKLEENVQVEMYNIGAIDHLIAAKALEAMKDDGRAVMIIGADKKAGGVSRQDRIFFNWLYSSYNVIDHFEVNGDLYKRQGAGWPVRVITISGRKFDSEIKSPKAGTIERVNTWEEVYEHYEAVVSSGQQRSDEGRADDSGNIGEPTREDGEVRPGGILLPSSGEITGEGGRSGVGPGLVSGVSGGSTAQGIEEDDSGVADAGGSVPGSDDEQLASSEVEKGQPKTDQGVSGNDVRGTNDSVIDRSSTEVSASEFQTVYLSRSSGFNEKILIAKNMAGPMQEALRDLEEKVGMTLDQYVLEKLQYDSLESLHKAYMGLQVDAVAAAIYNKEVRNKGTIIADQTGVGKGRQAAAMIRHARLNGQTPIFVTVETNLFKDMFEELNKIGELDNRPLIINKGAGIKTEDFGSVKPIKPGELEQKFQEILETGEMPAENNVVFMTYSQIQTDNQQRSVIRALGPNAAFILDESHKAAGPRESVKKENGVKVTKETGAGFIYNVIEDRPVVYLSATYAKRPDNMPVYYRTDMMDAVDSPEDLIIAVEAGGVPLQQILASMNAKSGQLFRRERSFEGISIPTEIDLENGPEHIEIADSVTEGLRAIVAADRMFNNVFFDILQQQVESGGSALLPGGSQADRSLDTNNFNSIVHNAVKQMLLSIKAKGTVEEAIKTHKEGKKIVIAFQNTMGSALETYVKDNGLEIGDEVDIDYRDVLRQALKGTRYVRIDDEFGNDKKVKVLIELDQLDPTTRQAYDDAEEIISQIDVSGMPVSPVDYMTHELTKAGIRAAEITGRDIFLDYETEPPTLRKVNKKYDKNEKIDDYNTNRLDALIGNQSMSTGLSIHASKEFKNYDGTPQAIRKMFVIQAFDDVNILIQMLGRINRTGQDELPEFALKSANLSAEKRPMANNAKKLKSLNANTSANDESDTSIDAPDMQNRYGDRIANDYLLENPDVMSLLDLGNRVKLEGAPDSDLMKVMTGRMALLSNQMSEDIYAELEESYEARINYLTQIGQNDLIAATVDLDARIVDSRIVYEGKDPTTIFGANTTLHKVDAKYQGKPPTPEDAEAALDNVKSDTVAQDIIDKKDSDTAYIEKVQAQLAELQSALDALRANPVGEEASDKEKIKYEAKESSFANAVQLQQEKIGQYTQLKQAAKTLIKQFDIGNRFRLNVGDDQVTGIVINVKDGHRPGKGNPYSLSKTKVTFLVNTGIRQVELPLTQLINQDGSDVVLAEQSGSGKENLDRIFTQAETNKRETRYVATDNLIAGLAELPGGRIVMFTDNEGNERQGILMPRAYGRKGEFETAGSQKSFNIRDADVIVKLLTDYRNDMTSAGGVMSGNQLVRVLPAAMNDKFKLQVPKAQKDAIANKVRFDPVLRKLVGDTAGSGQIMSVSFDADKLKPVVERVLEITPLYALSSMRDNAVASGAPAAQEAVKSFDSANSQDTTSDQDQDSGDDEPFFSKLEGKPGNTSAAQVKKWLKKPMKRLNMEFGTNVKIIENAADVDIPSIQQKVKEHEQTNPDFMGVGVYYQGTVYLFAKNIADARTARLALAHELIGHKGVLDMGANTDKQYQAILDTIDKLLNDNNRVAMSIGEEVSRRYQELEYNSRQWKNEFLAVAAERREGAGRVGQLLEKVKNLLRKILKAIGFNAFSETELGKILSNSERYLSKSGNAQDSNEVYLSQIAAAAKLTPEEIEEWRKANKVSQRRGRVPEAQEAAKSLAAGEMSTEDYQSVINRFMPIMPMTEVPPLTGSRNISAAVTPQKAKNILNVDTVIESGTRVASRLDIPAYDFYNTWVTTIHDGSVRGGKAVAYAGHAAMNNVEFVTNPRAALNIATGDSSKAPFARIHGDWDNMSPREARKKAVSALSDPDWVQVGMNPFRNSYFYDKQNGAPVVAAEEVVQIGPLVMAKGVKYASPTDAQFEVGDTGVFFAKEAPEFYSSLKKAVFGLKQQKGSPTQMLNSIKKSPGVKAEEIEWTGLEQYMSLLEGPVTKQQIIEYLDANGVQVNTVVLSTAASPYDDMTINYTEFRAEQSRWAVKFADEKIVFISDSNMPFNASKSDVEAYARRSQKLFGTYEGGPKYDGEELNIEGGTNYREVLLTLPVHKGHPLDAQIQAGLAELGWDTELDAASPVSLTRAGRQDLAKKLIERNKATKSELDRKYTGPHYTSTPNVLAHIRMDDREDTEGRKVLFVQEIQSDWHQSGKKTGYQDPAEIERLSKINDIKARLSVLDNRDRNYLPNRSAEEVDEIIDLMELLSALEDTVSDELIMLGEPPGVPNAPFKGNAWVELSAKKILAIAAEGGYDSVAWTTGEQQAYRYNIVGEGLRSFYDKTLPNVFKKVTKKLDKSASFSVFTSKDSATTAFSGQIEFSSEENVDDFLMDVQNIQGIISYDYGRVEETLIDFEDIPESIYRNFLPIAESLGGKLKSESYRPIGVQGVVAHEMPVTAKMKNQLRDGQPLFSKVDKKNSNITRRRFVQAAALSTLAIPIYGNQTTPGATLGRAKAFDHETLDKALPENVLKLIADGKPGLALQWIAESGPAELRPLAKQIYNLFPDNVQSQIKEVQIIPGKEQLTYSGRWSYIGQQQGLIELVHPQVKEADGSLREDDGRKYSTFLHEALHAIVGGRYSRISRALKTNYRITDVSQPEAMEVMTQFRALWREFNAEIEKGKKRGKTFSVATEIAAKTPDEFFVRSLVDPDVQADLVKMEYDGKTLWARFKDWVKFSFFGFKSVGTVPSWLDAALLSSNELIGAMSFDKADFNFSDAIKEQMEKQEDDYNRTRHSSATTENLPSDAVEVVERTINLKTSKRVRIKEWWNNVSPRMGTRLHQGLVDQYRSIKDILGNDRAWKMAHLTKSSTGVIEAMWDFGRPYMTANTIAIDTDMSSVREILEPLGTELDRWTYWIAGNRANRLKGEDRENLFTENDIEILMNLDQNTEEWPDRSAVYEAVRLEFEAMNDAVARIAVESGLLAEEEADKWIEEGFYLPFYRVAAENDQNGSFLSSTELVRQEAFKRLKGGTQKLEDLLENQFMNWNHMIHASLNNQAAWEALQSAEELGFATEVTSNRKRPNSLWVKIDGKRVWFNLDDSPEGQLVQESLIALNQKGMDGLMMMASRAFKRALTTGVTASPEFKIRNLIRDSLSAIAVAPMSVDIVKNMKQGWKATGKDEWMHAQLLASGAIFGDSGYIHGADTEMLKAVIAKGHERDTILDSRSFIKKAWNKYQDFGARLENINRAANYVQTYEETGDRLDAAFQSRDHLDFSRTGTFVAVRALSQVVPFLNARLQGLDKLARAARDPQQRGQFYTVVGVYSALSVLLYLLMKDDEDYKAAEQWERDAYHLFKFPGSDTMLRIPRPFEVGAIAAMTERLTEQLVDDEVHGKLFAQRLGHTLFETFSFNPTPQVFKPALEVAMDRNWFTGAPIEGMSLSRLSPEKRKRAWTSPFAVGVSEAMASVVPWESVQLSPVQMQHLVRGYFGWIGATSLSGADYLMRAATSAPVQPDWKATDLWVVKAFMRSDPARSTQYTTLFYNRWKKIQQASADLSDAEKAGDVEEYQRLIAETGSKVKLRRIYNRVGSNLSALRKRSEAIYADETMTGQQKRQALDEIQIKKNALTQLVDQRTRDKFQ